MWTLQIICLASQLCVWHPIETAEQKFATERDCRAAGMNIAVDRHRKFGLDFGIKCRPENEPPYKPAFL